MLLPSYYVATIIDTGVTVCSTHHESKTFRDITHLGVLLSQFFFVDTTSESHYCLYWQRFLHGMLIVLCSTISLYSARPTLKTSPRVSMHAPLIYVCLSFLCHFSIAVVKDGPKSITGRITGYDSCCPFDNSKLCLLEPKYLAISCCQIASTRHEANDSWKIIWILGKVYTTHASSETGACLAQLLIVLIRY